MPRKRKTPRMEPLHVTDLNQREVKVEMRSSPFPVQGPPRWHPGEDGPPAWQHREDGPLNGHPGESAPRDFHSHPRGNGPDSLKSVGAPRTRESKFSPAPNHFPRNPPGFANSISESRFSVKPSHFSRNPPGFDKSNSFHGVKMRVQESLEITSDRPFLPQKRAPPSGSNISCPSDQFPRGDHQGTRVELRGPSRSSQTIVAADDFNTQETSEGGPRKSLCTGKIREKMQPSVNDAQPSHAGTIASSFVKAIPPTLRPGILGERPSILGGPPGPSSGGAMVQKSATIDSSSESPSDVCMKIWKDLGLAMQKRERALRERERNCTQNNTNKQALEEEIKQAAAMKNEVMEERRRLEEEAQKIRKEKDAMERIGTDIAVQMAELKQVQNQIDKEKAAILALKSELGARERCSQDRECVEATVHIPLGAVKAEIEEPISNSSINRRQIVNSSSDLGATPSNRQIQEPDMVMDIHAISKISAAVNDRYWESVKAEPVAAGWNDDRRCYDNSSEDDVDDVPLALRLKKRRVEKTGQKSRSSGEIKHSESNVESSQRRAGSQSVGGKSQSYDIHMKRNKVPIEVALQEDAPGLLEQLEERGLLEDMAVYQDMEVDDSLAMECTGSEFGVLEGVIGKLWGPSAGLGKDLVPVKGQASGNMPRYCLSCLLALIEQAKSLRKRKWPVEWGWCRRLKAFLFVFEKHNRIVLERPEYGYATYFFELVQKLPVRWQVQRLITVMSVATTGRAALLENRQLEVGVHLSNEEAAILEDYGWNPSSGLGSLLNFCERVVHDYNKGQEDLGNDWKQKMGKLLMDGYDHGSIVQSIPRKLQRVLGNNLSNTNLFAGPQVKAEPP